MAAVSEGDVLLLWRALRSFRSGARPTCAPRGRPAVSACPLFDHCPRWHGQADDAIASITETVAQTEHRQATWPCSRLLDVLSPYVTRIGS
jgi:hypothetical protein